MRTSAGFVLALAAVIACGDDGGGNNNGDPDARTGDGFDGGTSVDASVTDASPVDAPLLDATPATLDANVALPVSVTVATPLGPVADVDVVYHDAVGNVIAELVTDASGGASFDVLPGASITVAAVVSTFGTRYELYTILDVQPPQSFNLLIPQLSEVINPTIGYTVSDVQPSGVVATNATNFVADNGCASSSVDAPLAGPISVPVRLQCDGANPAPRDVLIWALDDANVHIGYAFATDQAVEMSQGDNPVTIDTWHAGTTCVAMVQSAPQDLVVDNLSFWQHREGVDYYSTSADPATPIQLSLGVDTGWEWNSAMLFADSFWVSLGITYGTIANPTGGRAYALVRDSSTPDVVPFVLNAMLPRTHSPAAAVDVDDLATITWSTDSPVTMADALHVSLSWTGMAEPRAWHVLAPVGASPLVLPDLPAGLDAWRPTQSDTLAVDDLTYWEVTTMADYGAFQAWHDIGAYGGDVYALGSSFILAQARGAD